MLVQRDGPAPGAVNMATDAAMLEGRRPAFRTYAWQPHCLSLGRFEDEADVDRGAAEELGIEVVRRPTGGGAILHGLDVTFCLVRPAPPGATVADLYSENARAVAAGLALLGIEASCSDDVGSPDVAACFAGARGPDLRVAGRKVCGSALRLTRGWCLMHGSIPLEADWDRTARLLPGTDAAALARAAITIDEVKPGTTRADVEEALAAGAPACFDLAGAFIGDEACEPRANPQAAL